jgi:hypothetical protein
VERYTLPNTEHGLILLMELAVSLRRLGYKTRLIERAMARFPVATLIATRTRPNRKERGCLC